MKTHVDRAQLQTITAAMVIKIKARDLLLIMNMMLIEMMMKAQRSYAHTRMDCRSADVA